MKQNNRKRKKIKNKILKKILPKTKKKKVHKQTTGEPDKDENNTPVDIKNMDTSDNDDMLPLI